MDLITALKKIGFTQQEAIIYIELSRHNEMTGYEAAKLSGISRSNAYAALSNLVDKGYAYVIEGTSAKYTPVPKNELLMNARRDFDDNLKVIEEELNNRTLKQEPYITIKDEKPILDKLKNMLVEAQKRVYLSCDDNVVEQVQAEIEKAVERGLKVVVLSQKPLAQVEYTHYYREKASSLKLITDTSEVLAGTLSQCLYSRNVTLVQLIREAFINEITIIENNQTS